MSEMTKIPPRDAEMRMMVTCPFMPISSNISSHRAAQGVMYADQIRHRYPNSIVDINWSGRLKNYEDYDLVWIYHGNDLHGPRKSQALSNEVNMFGDVFGYPYAYNTEEFFNNYRGPCISVGIPMPNYHDYVVMKIKNCLARGKTPMREFLELDMDNLKRVTTETPFVKFPLVTDKLVIGDSHSICMYRPGWTVNSVPFKTLNGALSEGLDVYVRDVGPIDSFSEIEVYFGNIDVRHHICRLFPDREVRMAEIRSLVERYATALENLSKLSGATVSAYELLPIESEARKVPKTGWHAGKPFWGTREERDEVRLYFRENLEKKVRVIRWVSYLENPVTGELEFKYMEKPHSIHLSREFYPYWQGDDGKKFIKVLGPRRGDWTRAPRPSKSNANSLEDLIS